MRRATRWMELCAVLLAASMAVAQRGSVGFDKNGYPGDELLPALHRTFVFTGFWLNDPPGMQSNPWAGKRSVVRAAGFGFLLEFNGKLKAELKKDSPERTGRDDGQAAVAAARHEGFPSGAVIFLDMEEGGPLLPEQLLYIGGWVRAVETAGFGGGAIAREFQSGRNRRRGRRRRIWWHIFRVRSCGCGMTDVLRFRAA